MAGADARSRITGQVERARLVRRCRLVGGVRPRFGSRCRASADSTRQRLGELLVSRGIAPPDQIEEALSQQESGALFGQLLVDMGTISQSDLLETLAEQFGVQSIDL